MKESSRCALFSKRAGYKLYIMVPYVYICIHICLAITIRREEAVSLRVREHVEGVEGRGFGRA